MGGTSFVRGAFTKKWPCKDGRITGLSHTITNAWPVCSQISSVLLSMNGTYNRFGFHRIQTTTSIVLCMALYFDKT